MHVRRVAVIGPPGAGKSTASRVLARATGLPLIHLDRHFWKEGWVPTPRDEWRRMQRRIIAGDSWIIDGNYGGTLDLRLRAADSVIFLDPPRHLYIRRVVTRMLKGFFLRETRPDMAPGCSERPDLNWFRFLGWVCSFHRDGRPELVEQVRDLPPGTRLYWLRRPEEVRQLAAALAREESDRPPC
ncbi:MAG: hypothetical protein R6U70_02500 [Bacillota bacterium]